jgi:hypothetical protein
MPYNVLIQTESFLVSTCHLYHVLCAELKLNLVLIKFIHLVRTVAHDIVEGVGVESQPDTFKSDFSSLLKGSSLGKNFLCVHILSNNKINRLIEENRSMITIVYVRDTRVFMETPPSWCVIFKQNSVGERRTLVLFVNE